MGNPFCHVELNTTDVNKAKAFYTKLFDWELEDIPMPDGAYSMIKVGEGTGGGLMKNPIPGAPSFWLSYVLVDDIEAATKKAKSLGASVMKDVTEVMGAGWLSIIADPTGAQGRPQYGRTLSPVNSCEQTQGPSVACRVHISQRAQQLGPKPQRGRAGPGLGRHGAGAPPHIVKELRGGAS